MKKFPNEFYRAISDNSNNFDDNGYIKLAAFQFNKNPSRRDSFEEMSVNWNDSPESLKILMTVKNRNGKQLASFGYVCIPRALLHCKFQPLFDTKVIDYERSPIKGNFFKKIKSNKYHGNILFKSTKSKKDRVALQEVLANYSNSCVVSREEYYALIKIKK